MKIFDLIKADFMKMRRTSFYWIHISMPIIGILIFLGYYSFSVWSAESKVLAYLEVISISFPFLIGIVCSMVVEQEFMAGRFKEILSTEWGKRKNILSKIIMLLLMALFSLILAICGFLVGFQFILKQNVLPLSFFIYSILFIFASQIFLYLFHIWLSLFLGKGASITMGIFESLSAALLLTGLGEGIWYFIPCVWAARFCDYFVANWSGSIGMISIISEVKIGVISSIVITILFGIYLGIRINFFEGREER